MSKIFTKTELKEVERRLSGQKKDYAIWQRAKHKVKELIEWSFLVDELRSLIGVKGK